MTMKAALLIWLLYTRAVLVVVGTGGPVGCWTFTSQQLEEDFLIASGGLDVTGTTVTLCSDMCGVWELPYSALFNSNICVCADRLPNWTKDSICGSESVHFYDSNIQTEPDIIVEQLDWEEAIFDFSLNNSDPAAVYTVVASDGLRLEAVDSSGFSVPLLNPGQQFVSCVDETTQEVLAVKEVTADASVWNYTLKCPELGRLFESVDCELNFVAGSEIGLVSADFNITTNWLIESGYNWIVGPEPASSDWLMPGDTSGTPIYMPLSQINHNGYLIAFRFHCSSPGEIELSVWKPACSDYCWQTNECGGSCTVPDEVSVCGGYGFCGMESTCCMQPANRALDPASYELVQSFPINIQSGWQVLPVREPQYVEAGYILSWTSLGGVISQTLNSSFGGIDSVGGSSTPGRHMVMASIAALNSVYLPVMLDIPGFKEVSVQQTDTNRTITTSILVISVNTSVEINTSRPEVILGESFVMDIELYASTDISCNLNLSQSFYRTMTLEKCYEGCKVNETLMPAEVGDYEIYIICQDTLENVVNDSALVYVIKPEFYVPNKIYPAEEELTVQFSLKPLDDTPIDVEVLIDGVPTIALPSYNSTADMYTIAIPTQHDGDHVISVNLVTALGSAKTYTESFHCFTRLSGLTAHTEYGTFTEGGSLSLPPIPYSNISQSGFYLGISKAAGTNVTITVDWGDNLTSTDQVPANLHHDYSTGGNYRINIVVMTPLSEQNLALDVLIVNEIPDTIELVYKGGELTPDERFGVTVQITYPSYPDAFVPNEVTLTVSVNNSVSKTFYPMMFDTDYMVKMQSARNATITAEITNVIGQSFILEKFVILTFPITDMHLHVIPSHAPLNEPMTVGVSMLKGDEVYLSWDFGDGSPLVERFRNDEIPYDFTNHTYIETGTYTIEVVANNLMGRISITYDIVIQKPIREEGYYLITNSPTTYPNNLQITIGYRGNPEDLADEVDLLLDIGNGNYIQEALVLDDNLTSVYTLNTTEPGVFTGVATLMNLVSRISYPVEILSLSEIFNATVQVLWRPALPRNSLPGPGSGQNGDIFPKNQTLIYDITVEIGAPLSYMVTTEHVPTGAMYTCTYSRPENITFIAEKSGLYSVRVTVFNVLSSSNASTTFTVLESFSSDSIEIEDLTPVSYPNEPKQFRVVLTASCEGCNVTVVLGDNSENLRFHIAGDNETSEIFIDHIYKMKGEYTLIVLVKSSFSDTTSKVKTFPITSRNCSQPEIFIEDQRSFLEAKEIYKSVMFTTSANLALLCGDTSKNFKQWKVFKVDEDMGKREEEIDVSSFHSSTSAQLILPSLFLDLGFYELHFSVSMMKMTDDVDIKSEVSTYIEIIRTPLIGRMYSGESTLITKGSAEILTLEPYMFTVDPDLPPGWRADLVKFNWLCKRIGEHYPSHPITAQFLLNPKHMEQNANLVELDRGGCYGSGAGALNVMTGMLSLNTSMLIPGITYEIMVLMEAADGRLANPVMQIAIDSALQKPDVIVSCAKGAVCFQQNFGQLINPTNRLALYAECRSGCFAPMDYTWSIYHLDEYKFWRRIMPAEVYVQGISSRGLGVSHSLFSDYPDIKEFQFRLTLFSEFGTPNAQKGTAYMNIIVNDPPYGGTCWLSQQEVSEASKPFRVSCTGWIDDKQIARYELYAKHLHESDNSSRLIQYATSFYNTEVYFPPGKLENNYTLEIYMKILDTYKGFTTFSLGEARVPVGILTDSIGSNADLEAAMDSGSIQEVCSTANMISGLLDLLNSILITTFQNTSLSASSLKEFSADMNVNEAELNSFRNWVNTTMTDEANDNQKFEAVRSEVARVKGTMLKGLSGVGTGSIESLRLVSKAVQAVTATSIDLTRESQTHAMALNDRLVDQLEHLTSSSTQEEVTDVSLNIFNSIQCTFKGSSSQLDYPIQQDFEYAKEVWDYDTDLESKEPWMDGGGTADETLNSLQKYTSSNLQKDTTTQVVNHGLNSMDKVAKAVLTNMVPGENGLEIDSKDLQVSIKKDSVGSLTSKTIAAGAGEIDVPSYCVLRPDDCVNGTNVKGDTISIKSSAMAKNPFTYDSQAQSHKNPGVINSLTVSASSASVALEYFDDQGKPLIVRDLSTPIRIVIPNTSPVVNKFKQKTVPDRREYTLINELIAVESINVSLIIEFANVSDYETLMVYVNYNNRPRIVDQYYDARYILDVNSTAVTPAILRINETVIGGRKGTFYISFAPISNEVLQSNMTEDELETHLVANATFSYAIRSNTAGCYYYDEATKAMSSAGCYVGNRSSPKALECFCNHLTSFAGGWIVAPNTIDFTSLDFDPAKNPVIYVTLSVILVLYVTLVIWARRADKKDLIKLGCTPLECNDPLDRYLYEIVVNTGSRQDAGTKSKVFLIISGELDETDVKPITDTQRPILSRGQSDSFLMAVPRPLGQLQYIRVWHDNSGKGSSASWFLNYIIIKDLQTRQKYMFLANKWFAVEKGDGQIDRVIPVAGVGDVTSFSHLFTETSKQDLTDGHLWFSVFTRPPHSRFTRVQRVSCCLMLLMLSMVCSAMFYGLGPDESSAGLSIGPFSLTPQQIAIGFETNLIVFPVSLLVVQLFRKSRLRKKRASHLMQAIRETQYKMPSYYYPNVHSAARNSTMSDNEIITVVSTQNNGVEGKKKKKFMFPWWCRIIAWIVLWIGVLVSTAFVLMYSIQFGNDKTSSWLTSIVVSFLSSILITQPIKVLLVAIFMSLVIRSPKTDNDDEILDDEEEVVLDQDEEWLHYGNNASALKPSYSMSIKPLDPKVLEQLRAKRVKEVQMMDVLRELVIYICFVTILVMISYGSANTSSINFKSHMEDLFINKNTKNGQEFHKIRDSKAFWEWTRGTLIPNLRADPWYNGQPPVGLRGFLSDRTSRIMGFAVIRQLRMPKNTCGVPKQLVRYIHQCVDGYQTLEHDEGNYGYRWTASKADIRNNPEYIYREAIELDGLPYLGKLGLYSGGGYVFELRGDAEHLINRSKELEAGLWINDNTRAIFIEFTVYNVGTNLFTISQMLLEKPSSGSFVPSWRFSPMMLIQYVESTGMIVTLVFHGVFIIFLIGFVVVEIRMMRREGGKAYITSLWNWIEWVIISLSLTTIVLYIIRYIYMKNITARFRETKGNEYMKFDAVASWSELYTYLIGLLTFFVVIKLLKLLRFNKKIQYLSSTLSNCGRSLSMFGIMWGIVFFSFVQFFYIILLKDMIHFATFTKSFLTCLYMMLGKFDAQGMSSSNSLSPPFFMLFMIVNTFMLMNMGLSILIESFTMVKTDAERQGNEHEIVDYIFKKFKVWSGIGTGSHDETFKPDQVLMKSANEEDENDLIHQFPVRVDILMSTLKRYYLDGFNFDSDGPPQLEGSSKKMDKLRAVHAVQAKARIFISTGMSAASDGRKLTKSD